MSKHTKKNKHPSTSGPDWASMAKKHARNMKEPVNPNDPYGFVEEFDLNAYDRKYTEEARKVAKSIPPKSKSS